MLAAESTKHQIEQLLGSPIHGVLLSGPGGAGKSHVARYIAKELVRLSSPEDLVTYPYFRLVAPHNDSLGIDQVRELQKFLQLKVPGNQAIRRLAIIEDAHLMTTEAQNALLKSLEEPPADTVLILTAPATLRLKQTVYSRLQRITVLPISETAALDYFKDSFSEATIKKAYLMSNGHAGLLYALLHDKDHQLATEIKQAKQIISAPLFTRLTQVDELAKDKARLPLFLQACRLICSAALVGASQKADEKQVKRWVSALSSVYEAEAAVSHNPNTKLLLTHLFLRL